MSPLTHRHSPTSGFSLVELLFVISILALIGSIIFASINESRKRAADAVIKSDLRNILSQAGIYYDSEGNGDYTNFCTNDPTVTSALLQAASSSGAAEIVLDPNVAGDIGQVTCHSGSSTWAVEAPLSTNPEQFYCVDSTNAAGVTLSSSLLEGIYSCTIPAGLAEAHTIPSGTTGSVTHTTDADFNPGATSSAVVSGSGAAAGVKLLGDKTVAPVMEWRRTHGNNTVSYDVGIDTSSNIYVIGSGIGGVLKYDRDGNQSTFIPSYSGSSYYASLAVNKINNDVIVANNGDVRRYNSSGVLQCSASKSNTTDLAVDLNGNIYVVNGSSAGTKFDSSCQELATSTGFGTAGSSFGGIGVDSSGDFYIISSRVDAGSWARPITKKFSGSTGTELWSRQASVGAVSNTFVLGSGVYVDAQDNVYVSGKGSNSGGWTVSYTKDGTQRWIKNTNATTNRSYYYRHGRVAQNSLGHIMILESEVPNLATGGSFHLFPVNSLNGSLVWSGSGEAIFSFAGGGGYAYNYNIAVDSEDNIYTVGNSDTVGTHYSRAEILKLVPPYPTLGTYTSDTIDTGAPSDFGTVSWNATLPVAATTIGIQIATNSDNATWDFRGPDGTSGSYYDTNPAGENIHNIHSGDRYLKYKVFLNSTDSTKSPTLDDITITYTAQ